MAVGEELITMTRPLANEITRLVHKHAIPTEEKLYRRVESLHRMANFYREKIPEAPEKQALMFTAFISALMYAIATIKEYQKLTKELTEVARQVDENG